MKKKKERENQWKVLLAGLAIVLFSISFILAADPVYPDGLAYGANETKVASTALTANVTGGYISNFNLTATVQNPRWKAFVGQVIGAFTLDDAGGSTIYDWTQSTVTGRVYATRESSATTWAGIACATTGQMETENTALSLASSDDNITSTFADTTHQTFSVGATNIGQDTCPTLNTFVNDARDESGGQPFEEMVLYEGSDLVYATVMEDNVVGYDGSTYDFQMIVPQNGSAGSSNTLYYLYVELGN